MENNKPPVISNNTNTNRATRLAAKFVNISSNTNNNNNINDNNAMTKNPSAFPKTNANPANQLLNAAVNNVLSRVSDVLASLDVKFAADPTCVDSAFNRSSPQVQKSLENMLMRSDPEAIFFYIYFSPQEIAGNNNNNNNNNMNSNQQQNNNNPSSFEQTGRFRAGFGGSNEDPFLQSGSATGSGVAAASFINNNNNNMNSVSNCIVISDRALPITQDIFRIVYIARPRSVRDQLQDVSISNPILTKNRHSNNVGDDDDDDDADFEDGESDEGHQRQRKHHHHDDDTNFSTSSSGNLMLPNSASGTQTQTPKRDHRLASLGGSVNPNASNNMISLIPIADDAFFGSGGIQTSGPLPLGSSTFGEHHIQHSHELFDDNHNHSNDKNAEQQPTAASAEQFLTIDDLPPKSLLSADLLNDCFVGCVAHSPIDYFGLITKAIIQEPVETLAGAQKIVKALNEEHKKIIGGGGGIVQEDGIMSNNNSNNSDLQNNSNNRFSFSSSSSTISNTNLPSFPFPNVQGFQDVLTSEYETIERISRLYVPGRTLIGDSTTSSACSSNNINSSGMLQNANTNNNNNNSSLDNSPGRRNNNLNMGNSTLGPAAFFPDSNNALNTFRQEYALVSDALVEATQARALAQLQAPSGVVSHEHEEVVSNAVHGVNNLFESVRDFLFNFTRLAMRSARSIVKPGSLPVQERKPLLPLAKRTAKHQNMKRAADFSTVGSTSGGTSIALDRLRDDDNPLSEAAAWNTIRLDLEAVVAKLSHQSIDDLQAILIEGIQIFEGNPEQGVGVDCAEFSETTDKDLSNCKSVCLQLLGEANECLKHLRLAEPSFRQLHSAANFEELPEAMRSSMGQIRALTLLVTYYREPVHMERIIVCLVYEVINVCKRNFLKDGKLWDRCLSTADLKYVMHQLHQIHNATDLLRTYFIQYFPPHEAACLDALVIFGSLDLFQRRISKLKDMCVLTQTYIALCEGRLDSVDDLVDQFHSYFQDLQRRCGNPFEHSKPMFDRDFAEFRTAIADLDCELLLYVNAAYERRTTTLSALKLMERFDTLLEREALRTDFQSKFFQLIQRFTSEVETTMRAFEQSKMDPPTPRGSGPVSGRILWARHLYRKINEPMMLFAKIDKHFGWNIFSNNRNNNTAAVASASSANNNNANNTSSASLLSNTNNNNNNNNNNNPFINKFAADETRAERQQAQQQFAMNMGIVKKTLRLYNDVACALVDYEDVWVDAWLKSVDVTRSGLQATVFIREQVNAAVVQGKFANHQFSVGEWDDLSVAATAASTASQFRPYSVNFDPALLALWIDARWLNCLGIDIGQRGNDVEQQRLRVMMCVSRLRLLLDAVTAIRKQTPPELFYVLSQYRMQIDDKIETGAQSISYMSAGLVQYIDECEELTYSTLELLRQASGYLKTLVSQPLSQIAAATLFLRSPTAASISSDLLMSSLLLNSSFIGGDASFNVNSNANNHKTGNNNNMANNASTQQQIDEMHYLASQYMDDPNVVIDFGDLLEQEQQYMKQMMNSHQENNIFYNNNNNNNNASSSSTFLSNTTTTSSSSSSSSQQNQQEQHQHFQNLLNSRKLLLTPQALANRCKAVLDGVIRVARCFIPKWTPNEPPCPEDNATWKHLQKFYVLIHNQLQRAVLAASSKSLQILKKRIGSRPAPHLFASDGSLKITIRVDFTPLNERAILVGMRNRAVILNAAGPASTSEFHYLVSSWGAPGAGMLSQLQQQNAIANANNNNNNNNHNSNSLVNSHANSRSASIAEGHNQLRRQSSARHMNMSVASSSGIGGGTMQRTQSFAQIMARHSSGHRFSVAASSLSAGSSAEFGSGSLANHMQRRRSSTASNSHSPAFRENARRATSADNRVSMPNALVPVSGQSTQQQQQHDQQHITFSLRKQQEEELDSIVLQEDVRYIDQIRDVQQSALDDGLLHLQKHYDSTLYGPSYIQLSPCLDEIDKTLASLVSDVVTAARRIRSWPKVPTVTVATNESTGALEERAQTSQQHNNNNQNNNNTHGLFSNSNDPAKSGKQVPGSGTASPHRRSLYLMSSMKNSVAFPTKATWSHPFSSVLASPSTGNMQGAIGNSNHLRHSTTSANSAAKQNEDKFLPAFYHRVAKSTEVMKTSLIIAGSIYALKQEVVRSAQMLISRFSFLLIMDRRLVVDTFMRRFDRSFTLSNNNNSRKQNKSSNYTGSNVAAATNSITQQQESFYLPVSEVLLEVQALDSLEKEIIKAPETFTVGSVVLDFKGFLAQCAKETKVWRSEFTSRFLSLISRRLDLLTHTVESLQRRLVDRRVIEVTQVCATMKLLARTRSADSDSVQILATMGRALESFESYEPRRVHELVDTCLEIRKKWDAVRPLATYKRDEMQCLQQIYRQEAVLLAQQFRVDLESFRNSFLVDGPAALGVSPTEAMLRLKRYGRALEERKLQFETLFDLEGILNMTQHQYPELARTFVEASQLQSLYELYEEVSNQITVWSDTPWKKINVIELGEDVSEMIVRVRRLPAAVKDWGAYMEMRRRLDELSNAVPVLESLSSKSVKDRHWNEVMKITGTKWDNSDPDQVLLAQILSANVARFREEIVDVAGSSEKEGEIENRLRAIAIDWKSKPLTFAEYKNRGLISLKNEETSALKDQLDESLLTLSAMLASRYSSPFKSEVNTWLSKLGQTQEALTLWTEVQSLWMYLEAVFSGGDIVRQLPQDAKRFAMIDKQWGKIFARAVEVVSVIDFCVGNDLLKGLPYLQSQMAQCQKSLAAYLEQKRSFFPRFYFVSDAVLLEMLAQGSDPVQLQAHFLNVFDGVASVNIEMKKASEVQSNNNNNNNNARNTNNNNNNNATMKNKPISGNNALMGSVSRITSVRNTANEQLDLIEEVLCVGNIEVWLQDLLNETHRALRQVMRSALTDAQDVMNQPGVTLTNFLFAYPSQVVLAVLQILWTQDCSSALATIGPTRQNRRMDTSKRLQAMREVLAEAAKRMDTAQKQIHLQNVTGLIVHGQDVWEGVGRRCRDASSFDWLRQLRVYWTEKHTAQLQLTDANIAYCDEFLDLHERLVVTQLTDRCYTTLSQALAMHMGGAPSGPAGTGKTETVKDLGRTAGKWVVVFNCSDQFDVRSLGKIFKGLASSGSWGCFDEFNRISLPVLSVVAQQISTVLSAMRHKRSEFIFADGSTIPLLPSCGIFVTMNPTYAGRQELPENLKSLLRGVAMMVPDQQSIMQVRLASSGYRNDGGLAHRFYMLYSLCQQQLSKQPHYDWGLRNTLSVLRAAGDALRRTVLQATENAIKKKLEAELIARTRRERKQQQQQQSQPNTASSRHVMINLDGNNTSNDAAAASSASATQQKEQLQQIQQIAAAAAASATTNATAISVDEEAVFVRTLRDMNLSKLTYEDVPVFTSLLNSLFPFASGIDPAGAYPELQQTLITCAEEELRLEPTPQWTKKALQLYENKCVRHGIMLVGAAGSGKSMCMTALLKSLRTYENSRCREVRLNPKAITTEQMFGRVDPSTGDWYDGVFSSLWRRYCRQNNNNSNNNKENNNNGGSNSNNLVSNSNQQIFIVCDGPIDTLWVESLNTVLDDNKLLTLANGDRILMAPNVKMCFEAEHLVHASPATVSRAGIVFFSPEDVGALPVIVAGIRHFERTGLWPAFAVHVAISLAEQCYEDLLKVVEKSLKRESPHAPGVNRCHASWQLLQLVGPIIADAATCYDSDEANGDDQDAENGENNSSSLASPYSKQQDRNRRGSEAGDYLNNSQKKKSNKNMNATEVRNQAEKLQKFREKVIARVFLWSCAWSVAGPFGDDEKREANGVVRQVLTSSKEFELPFSSKKMTARSKFDSDMSSTATQGNDEKSSDFSFFDVFWNFATNSWTSWSSIVQTWSSSSSLVTPFSLTISGGAVDIHRAFVPTAQSVCFEALSSLCFVNRIPIAVTGTSGAGKSVILQQAGANFTLAGLQAYRGTASTIAQQRQILQQLRMSGPSSALVSDSSKTRLTEGALENLQSRGFINSKEYHVCSSTTPHSFQMAVEEMCEKRVGSTYGPRRGHQLFLVIEDLHMSPANEWNDQPASELLRQLLERSGFYDLERVGDWKNLVDIQFGATFAATSSGGSASAASLIPARLLRHFFTVHLSLPPVETLERVCSALLRARLNLLPKAALSAQHADAAVRVLIDVWKAAEKKLLPTPARLFCTFNWRDVTNVMQGLFVSSSTCFESIPYFTATLRHELSRAMCDKLNLKEDAAWLQDRIHEAVLKETLLHGSSARLSSDETLLCPFLSNNFVSANANLDIVTSEGNGESPITQNEPRNNNNNQNATSSSSSTTTTRFLDPSSMNQMRSKLASALQLFNATRPKKKTTPQSMEMDLVLFDDSIRHVLRISRALSTPRGNIILMGGAGGGKVSLARLASYCCGPDTVCVQPLPMSSYGFTNFMDDLRSACVHAATKGPVAFVLTDADVKSDAFLEPVGSLLASGESPGLFPIDERDSAISAMRPKAKNLFGRTFDDSEENIWNVFVQRVQAHLHFVFCFSLESGLLTACAQKFPSIFRHSLIDFVHAWPSEALESVAAARLAIVNEESGGALSIAVENPAQILAAETALQSGEATNNQQQSHQKSQQQHHHLPVGNNSVLSALCAATAKIHEGARELCQEYHRQYRVNVSCCSTHFLTLLTEFKAHFHVKNKSLRRSMKELRGGLDKMNAAAGDVRAMRTTLDLKEALLREAQAETDALLREILQSKVDAETKRQVIASVADVLARDAAIIDATKVEAESDLRKAEPALHAARAALNQITSNDMKTLKALQKPPEMIKRIFDGVCILYHHPMEEVDFEVDHRRGGKIVMKDSWVKGGRTLATRIDFLDLMMSFNEKRKDHINDETCELLQPYLWQDDFTYERARAASGNVAGLCTWVRAMEQYRAMSKFVAPKIETLRIAQGRLRAANLKLERQRKELDAAEHALASCETRFAAGQKKKQVLEDDASNTRRRMNYASDLLLALADENKRWQLDFAQLRISKVRTPASVLACAALLTYAGPFNSVFREKLRTDVIVPALASVNMPLSSTFNFCKYLVDSDDVIEGWHLHGLPADAQSVENAVFTAMGSRVPIMIDPQEQATSWVKKTIATLHRQNVAKMEKWRESKKLEREERLRRMREGDEDLASFGPAGGPLGNGDASQEELELADPSRPTPLPVPANVVFLSTARSNFDSSLESALPTSSMAVIFVDNNEKGSSITLPALLDSLVKVIQGAQQPWIRATLNEVSSNNKISGKDESEDDDDDDAEFGPSHKNTTQVFASGKNLLQGKTSFVLPNSASSSAKMSFRLPSTSGGNKPLLTSSRVVHLLGEPYDLHKDFCLMLVSKSPAANFGPDAFLQGTIIDFRVTEAGLREQLLARVVQYEREDLEARKTNLMKQINDSQTALRLQEKGLLHKLSSVEGSLVEDETVILTLAQSKQLANELKETLGTSARTRTNIDDARNAYAVVARRGAAMYFASDEMSKLSPCYVFSLDQFLVIFDRAMRGGDDKNNNNKEQGQNSNNKEQDTSGGNKMRIQQLLDDVSFAIFSYVGRGFYEHHKPLFSLLIAARIEMSSGRLTAAAFSALLTGGTALSNQEAVAIRAKNVHWLPMSAWKHVVALSGSSSPFPQLAQLPEMIPRFEQEFKDWYLSANPESTNLPPPYGNKIPNINNSKTATSISDLPLFTQLAFIRILREDRMFAAASVALEHLLGPRFSEVPPFTLDVLTTEVQGPATPFLFLLSTGTDPGASIEAAARRKKTQLLQQSLGQGQEEAAFFAVQRASAAGSWALLNNCHLSPKFLVRLEEWTSKVNEILTAYYEKIAKDPSLALTNNDESNTNNVSNSQQPNNNSNPLHQQLMAADKNKSISNLNTNSPQFNLQNINPAILKECRVFLTSAPVSDLPIALLQRCIKLTQEPPQGIRSTVQRTCALIGKETLSAVSRSEWRPTIRALIRLHVTLLERSKIGVEGWTGEYAFTDGDFLASFAFIQSHFSSIGDETKSDNPGPVSWEALRYIVGDIHYGGRVTYTKDRCILQFLSETLLSPQNCTASKSTTSSSSSPANVNNSFDTSLQQQQSAAREAQISAVQFFQQVVEELSDPSVVTGVQPLSIKAHQTRKCAAALQLLRDVQPRETAVAGNNGQTPEQIVLALIRDIIHTKLPAPASVQPPAHFNTHSARPLDIFFGLEAQRYANLLIVTKDLLASVAGAIEGTQSFNEERSETMRSLFQGLTPQSLAKYSWSAPRTVPSPRSLTAWLSSLVRRCAQIQRHFATATGSHKNNNTANQVSSNNNNSTIGVGAYWIGGFFNPQGFVQAVRQECCRFKSTSWTLDQTEALMEVVGTSARTGGISGNNNAGATAAALLSTKSSLLNNNGGDEANNTNQASANAAAFGNFESLERLSASNDGSVLLFDVRLEGCQYDVQAKKLRPLGARLPNGGAFSQRLPAVHLSAVVASAKEKEGGGGGAKSAGAVAYSQFIPVSNFTASAATKDGNSNSNDLVPVPPSSVNENASSTNHRFARRESTLNNNNNNLNQTRGGEFAAKFFSHSAHFGSTWSHIQQQQYDKELANKHNNGSNSNVHGANHHNQNSASQLQQGPTKSILIPLYRDPERTDISLIGFVSVLQDEINPAVWAVRGACAIADEES